MWVCPHYTLAGGLLQSAHLLHNALLLQLGACAYMIHTVHNARLPPEGCQSCCCCRNTNWAGPTTAGPPPAAGHHSSCCWPQADHPAPQCPPQAPCCRAPAYLPNMVVPHYEVQAQLLQGTDLAAAATQHACVPRQCTAGAESSLDTRAPQRTAGAPPYPADARGSTAAHAPLCAAGLHLLQGASPTAAGLRPIRQHHGVGCSPLVVRPAAAPVAYGAGWARCGCAAPTAAAGWTAPALVLALQARPLPAGRGEERGRGRGTAARRERPQALLRRG